MTSTKVYYGALTSKPYAFKARPWELRSIDYIDFLDALGSNIRVDIRDEQILRVLPRTKFSVNEEWITDRIRFAHDGLKNQRLTTGLVRIHNKLLIKDMNQIIQVLTLGAFTKNATKIAGYMGANLDILKNVLIKDFFNTTGATTPYQPSTKAGNDVDLRTNYICNTPFSKLEEADLCLLVGTSLRLEAPLLNLKLRRLKATNDNLKIYLVGPAVNLTYDYEHLGIDTTPLIQFFRGKNLNLNRAFEKAKKPVVFVGELMKDQQKQLLRNFFLNNSLLFKNLINSGWNGLNYLALSSGSLSAMEVANFTKNSTNHKGYERNYSMFFSFDEFNKNLMKEKHELFAYFGSHGDFTVNIADVIIPTANPLESTNLFTDLQGSYTITPQVFNFNATKMYNPIYLSIKDNIKHIKLLNPFALYPTTSKMLFNLQLSTSRQLNNIRDDWLLTKFKLFVVVSNLTKNSMTKYNLRICQLISRLKVSHHIEINDRNDASTLVNFSLNNDNYPEFCFSDQVFSVRHSHKQTYKTIKYNIEPELLSTNIDNYYRQDSISRASPTRNLAQKRLFINSNFS